MTKYEAGDLVTTALHDQLVLLYGTKDFLRQYRRRNKANYIYAQRDEVAKVQAKYLRVSEPEAKVRKPIAEKILHAAWVKAGQKGLRLKGRDGMLYKVIYAGRPSPGYGPDFRDAVIEGQSGERMYGNIEIHVRQGDWYSHKHQHDERYNGVLFHVCMEGGGHDAVTKTGRKIPLLLLSPDTGSGKPQSLPEEGKRLPVTFSDMGAAGDARFFKRAAYLNLEIDRLGVDQALYVGIMECLGYPNNKRFFCMLASKVPWAVLANLEVRCIHNRLLSAENLPAGGTNAKALKGVPRKWVVAAGRPDNHPLRRIKSAASIAARMASAGGPAAYCENFVRKSTFSTMADWFIVRDEGEERALIGKGRAGEIIINAALPGVYAFARKNGDETLSQACLSIYRQYPALPSNSILRAAASVLKAQGIDVNGIGAREQQGMIHSYRLMISKVTHPQQLSLI